MGQPIHFLRWAGRTRHLLLLLTLATLVSARAFAQREGGVISIEGVVGGGATTYHTGETWYRRNRSNFGSVAIGLTFPEIGRVQPFIVGDRSTTLFEED